LKRNLDRAREILYSTKPYKLWCEEDVSEFSALCRDDLIAIYRGLDPKTYGRSVGKNTFSDVMEEYPDITDDKMNCLFVKKVNGEVVRRYRWKDIISGKVSNQDAKIKKLLRETISHQKLAFKQESIEGFGPVCYQCGCTTDDLHVDHMFPPLSHLIGSWLDENGPPRTQSSEHGGGCVFSIDDEERSWQIYHAEKCTLQMLCSQCNVRKSDNITIAGMTLSALLEELFSVPKNHTYKRYT